MTNDPKETFQQVAEFNRLIGDYNVRLGQTIAAGVSPMIKEQADLLVSTIESAVAHGEKLTQVKSPQEALQVQTALSTELGEKFQTTARKILETQQQTSGDLQSLLQEGMSTFTSETLSRLFKRA